MDLAQTQSGTSLEREQPTVPSAWSTAANLVIADILRDAAVPGIVLAVAHGDQPPEYVILGVDAAGRALTADSLFPVASITKLATALAILRLVADGRLDLDATLAGELPNAAAASADITVRSLLCHTAGLPPDVASDAAPYTAQLDWPILARACLATPTVIAPNTRVAYTNLGAGLLAIIVERRTGQPFAAALEELVLRPLGIEGYLGVEPPRPPIQLVGDFGEHTGTALEPYNSAFWRRLALPWGGMLTTAAGALVLVRAFAGMSSGFLPPTLLAAATSDQTGGLPGGMFPPLEWSRSPWGLGVEIRGTKVPHFTSDAVAPSGFGHGGASGCLVYCDPVADVAWTILGTRTFETWWTHWPRIDAAFLPHART